MSDTNIYRVARHGVSYANIECSLAFASKQACLIEDGKQQARDMGLALYRDHGIDPSSTNVVISDLRRTKESAIYAGFTKFVIHKSLNEVIHLTDLKELRSMLDDGLLPEAAIEQALLIRDKPPEQSVWITHGLVIAGLSHITGSYQDRRLIPRFGEIREFKL